MDIQAMDTLDIVVAGIGVAGSFALSSIFDELEVVGIDKREKPGHPVECGEIVPTKSEMKLLLPEVDELDDYSIFDIPKRFESNRTKYFCFVLPNGKSFDVEFEMHVVKRDEMIQTVAEESGKKLILKRRIVSLNNGNLKLDSGEEIKSRVVIAADGANSRIAKDLGVWKYDVVPAKQYVMEGVECDENTIYMYVGKEIAAGGYAWIIPKGNGVANVGVGFRKEFARPGDNIHKALDKFVKEYPHSSPMLKNAEIVSKIGAVVPVDLPLKKTVYDNVMLVGDAASMVISHVGAGIPTSMIAGKVAGEIASQYCLNGKPLERFEEEWRKRLLPAMERSYFIKRVWDVIGERDERINRVLSLASNKDMWKILRSQIPLKLRLSRFMLPLIPLLPF